MLIKVNKFNLQTYVTKKIPKTLKKSLPMQINAKFSLVKFLSVPKNV